MSCGLGFFWVWKWINNSVAASLAGYFGQLTRYWYIIFIPVESTRILVHSSSTSKNGASRNQSLTFWTSVFVVIRMFLRCRSVSGFAICVRTGTSSPTPARRIVSPTMTILLLQGTWPMWPAPQMPGLSHDGSLQKSRQLRPFKNIVCCLGPVHAAERV